MELIDRIDNHFRHYQVSFAVFLELSKVFDMLDHNIILHKLDLYSNRGVAKELLESYITNRLQFVQINYITSKIIIILVFHRDLYFVLFYLIYIYN